ncbi:hypothetical protein EMCRGX_G008422 [Ephydatia muelleri]
MQSRVDYITTTMKNPFYSLWINSEQESGPSLAPGQLIYVVPNNQSLTSYVFTAELMKRPEYGSKKTSSIYGLHGDDKKWKHVGDMPFACSMVDTLLLSDGGLLVVDGSTQQDTGKTTQDYSGETQHQLALVDQDYPKNRMNDGKCDARGRLWCGTMGYEKSPGEPVSSQGTLYCYHGESTFLVKSDSFDGSQPSQMHLYGVFTSPSLYGSTLGVQCPITWCWYLLGMYDDPEDQSLCVVEHKAIKSLCQGLVQQCCYTSRPSWELESFMKVPQIFVN